MKIAREGNTALREYYPELIWTNLSIDLSYVLSTSGGK